MLKYNDLFPIKFKKKSKKYAMLLLIGSIIQYIDYSQQNWIASFVTYVLYCMICHLADTITWLKSYYLIIWYVYKLFVKYC